MIPFPNLEITTKGRIAEVKLRNEDLAEMLKKAVERAGEKVKSVEVYPDSFVVITDLTDLEQKLANRGLKVTIEPKQIEIIVDRRQLINAFIRVTDITKKGFEIIDERDYILIRGKIVP